MALGQIGRMREELRLVALFYIHYLVHKKVIPVIPDEGSHLLKASILILNTHFTADYEL